MTLTLAALVAVCCATVSSVLFAFICGQLTPINSVMALVCGIIAGILSLRCSKVAAVSFTRSSQLLFLLFGLFALRAFCWVVFVNDDQIQVLSPNNLGDLSLHVTYVNY